MGTKYDLLKVITIAGTIFSIYNAYTNTLLLEDLIIVILIAATLVAVAKDLNREKHKKEAKAEKGLGLPFEETIRKYVAAE